MCGIAGLITKHGTPPDEGALRAITDRVKHRGPDGHGVWIGDGVGFGHRRLAIIDLNERAAQPMHTADRTLTITYNGEVYNYRDLREELVRKGSTFRTDSDTEVVLEAYRHYGKDCVNHLRGMFAFAIWDAKERRCFIARDRSGKKPFFYRTLSNGSVAFSSEMRALRLIEPATVDDCAIRLFIGLQYIPAPQTGLKEVVSLPAGHRGTIDAQGIFTESYLTEEHVEVERTGDVPGDILRLLDEAVRVRLRADVTVGAFLSGGIDSSAIVALAQKHSDRPLRTFTMGFPYIGMDERREARACAKRFGTDHTDFEAQPESIIRFLDTIIDQYGGPYADSSALPVMMLSREVAKEIKVVLVGDGGDELFGGYRRYRAFRTAAALARIPGAAVTLPPLFSAAGALLGDPRFTRMGETLRASRQDQNRGYAELFCGSYFSTRRAKDVFRPEFLASTRCDPAQFISKMMGTEGHALERAMKFDFDSYLADDLNVKMDRATMAFGLEARAPFLDQYMVAYALSMPLRHRMHGNQTKVALRQAMKRILPPEVLKRPKKGFQVPLAEWFRGPLTSYWSERCLDPASPLMRYTKKDRVRALFEENARGADHGNRLWMLLALSVWLDHVRNSS